MGTTALFAELVVGGILSLTWIGLLAMTVLGPSRVTPILETSSLAAGFFLALAYTLGVVFDRVWDVLLDVTGIQAWVRGRTAATKDTEIDRHRRKIYGADPKTAVDFVNYHRSRMRIARASVFNFTLKTASGMALIAFRFQGFTAPEFYMAGLAGSVIVFASATAFLKLGRTHDRVLQIVSSSAEDEERRICKIETTPLTEAETPGE